MSTKNFASYGDMETLMSGIKDAIDDAGGGGSPTKVTVKEYTDTTATLSAVLSDLYTQVNALSDDIRKKCYLELYSPTGGDSASKMVNKYVKLPFNLLGRDTNWGYGFGVVTGGNLNMFVNLGVSLQSVYIGTSSAWTNSSTLSTLLVSKIGLYYDMLADVTSEVQTELSSLDTRVTALEQGGGGTELTFTPANNSMTWRQFLYNIVNALSQQYPDLTALAGKIVKYKNNTTWFGGVVAQASSSTLSIITFDRNNVGPRATFQLNTGSADLNYYYYFASDDYSTRQPTTNTSLIFII